MIRIYLTTWTEVTSDNGRPLITDPIALHLGPNGVIPGMRGMASFPARKNVFKRPEKAPMLCICFGDPGTDFAELDSIPGVIPLDTDKMSIEIASIPKNRQRAIQKSLDDWSIPLTLTDYQTVGDFLQAFVVWLNPDRATKSLLPDSLLKAFG